MYIIHLKHVNCTLCNALVGFSCYEKLHAKTFKLHVHKCFLFS